MGWKWWIQWTKAMRKLKAFKSEKEKKLLDNLDLVSDIHDLDFEKGWWIKEFYKVNLFLIIRILKLLYWTSETSRVSLFIILFFWLNTMWIKYFNWNKIF